jgi:hypothetical protein
MSRIGYEVQLKRACNAEELEAVRDGLENAIFRVWEVAINKRFSLEQVAYQQVFETFLDARSWVFGTASSGAASVLTCVIYETGETNLVIDWFVMALHLLFWADAVGDIPDVGHLYSFRPEESFELLVSMLEKPTHVAVFTNYSDTYELFVQDTDVPHLTDEMKRALKQTHRLCEVRTNEDLGLYLFDFESGRDVPRQRIATATRTAMKRTSLLGKRKCILSDYIRGLENMVGERIFD